MSRELIKSKMEKLLIVDESVIFFSKPNVEDTTIRIGKKGDEFLITQVGKRDGVYWIKVAFDSTSEGYISEASKIAIILPVKLNQKEVTIYEQPYSKSKEITTIKKKEVFYLLHKTFGVDNKNIIWDKVKLSNGEFGYMEPNTKVVPIIEEEITRKKICLYLAIALQVLGFLGILSIFLADGVSFFSEDILILLGIAALGVFGVYVLEGIFEAISGLFKSKIEKYYYPNLFAVYNNKII